MRVAVTLLGGALVALYGSYSYFAPGSSRPVQLAEVTQIMTAPSSFQVAAATQVDAGRSDAEPRAAARIFSPQQPLLSPQPLPAPRVASETGRSAAQPVPARRSDPFGEAPVVQAVQPKAVPQPVLPAASPARKSGPSRPATEEARSTLVRDLQRELKRVGCFDGEMSGWWNQGTRRAIAEFTGKVNASLPIEEPDYILLALVQGHSGQACGACPAGQTAGAGGRCQPAAVVAGVAPPRKAIKPDDRRAGTANPAVAEPRAPGLTAAEAQVQLDQRAAAMAKQLASAPPPSRVRTWETSAFPSASSQVTVPPAPRATVAPALPLAPAPPAVATAATTTVAAAPAASLPGRMSIGAGALPSQPASPSVTGWQTGSLPEPHASHDQAHSAPRNSGPSSAGSGRGGPQARRTASRQDYYASPPRRPYYVDRAPAPRPRAGNSLRSAQSVKDFFYGPGRGSF
jgi:hypothetical protein